jgi:hypothetical protein
VQADDGRDRGEGADAEEQEQGQPLAPGALDRAEGFDGQDQDPDVGYDVEDGGGWVDWLALDTTSIAEEGYGGLTVEKCSAVNA